MEKIKGVDTETPIDSVPGQVISCAVEVHREPGNYKNPDPAIVTGSVYPVRTGTHVSVSYFFGGLIDEVGMYDTALSEEQIALLANDTPF
jgi:hypothetical protein